MPNAAAREELLELSHRIGRRGDLALLAEGNTSCRTGDDRMLVKASGHRLADLTSAGLVECRLSPLLEAVGSDEPLTEAQTDGLLRSAVVAGEGKPSVEAFFHAVLLSRPGVSVVAHAHPEELLAVLCSPLASDFALQRRFPDEVVCCGESSLLLPYTDPGLELARAIRRALPAGGATAAVVLLQNHGIICPGPTVAAVWAALIMTVKAAAVFRNAAMLGAVVPMPASEVRRIHTRLDEAQRRKALGLTP